MKGFRPRGGFACAASSAAAPISKIRKNGISRSARSRSTTVLETSAVSIAHSSRVSTLRRKHFVASGRIRAELDQICTLCPLKPSLQGSISNLARYGLAVDEAGVEVPGRIAEPGQHDRQAEEEGEAAPLPD